MADWDAAIAEAYASAPQDRIVLHTLEINHRSFPEPVRAVRWPVTDNEPTVFRCLLEDTAPYTPGQVVDFIGVPFDIVLPSKSTESAGQFQIRIDNIGDALDDYLENAALGGGQITAIYREYIKGDEHNGPRTVWEGIKINSPRMEGSTVSSEGAVMDWLEKPYSYLYTPENSPALVRSRN